MEKRPIEAVNSGSRGSRPGVPTERAGAEMLVERVREIIAPKTHTDDWLGDARKVHQARHRARPR
ncbi:MAG: hypothetical protein R3E96_05445 [Planctomycetota bacterium]